MYLEQLAEHNAKRGHKVAFYHLELTHQTMLDRRMARQSTVSIRELIRGYNGPEVARAMDALRPWQTNLVYVHCPGWSSERVAVDIARLYARGECDLALVDYLQKLRLPERRGFNSAMLVGQSAEALKNAAEQLNIPIAVASQVSRDFKSRKTRRPHMEDLRNSGELEEKANQIVILHRPLTRDPTHPQQTEPMEAHIEKNTLGALGRAKLVHLLGRFLIAAAAQPSATGETPAIPF